MDPALAPGGMWKAIFHGQAFQGPGVELPAQVEHGVGSLKADKLPRYKSAVALDLMGAIKRALDPQNLMNPGRVLRG